MRGSFRKHFISTISRSDGIAVSVHQLHFLARRELSISWESEQVLWQLI